MVAGLGLPIFRVFTVLLYVCTQEENKMFFFVQWIFSF